VFTQVREVSRQQCSL